jgi:hypothetical protein
MCLRVLLLYVGIVFCALFLSVTVSGWAAVCGVWAVGGDRGSIGVVES